MKWTKRPAAWRTTTPWWIFITLVIGLAGVVNGAQITEANFGPGEIVDDYSGLGAIFNQNCGGTPCAPVPLTLNGNVYTTSPADAGFLRYPNQPCFTGGNNDFCLNTFSDFGFIDVTLPVAYLRVGAWTENFAGPTVQYDFFGPGGGLLGTVTGIGFIAWEDAGGIARIRVTDMGSGSSMVFDHLAVDTPVNTQPVGTPEPATLSLLASGALAYLILRKARLR